MRRGNLASVSLPFDALDVFHSFKMTLESPGDDVDGEGLVKDWIKAVPPGKGKIGRFDTVVVMQTNDCESTGLEGKYFMCKPQAASSG